jgi:outer membrane lipoprotein-sorting protein
MSNKTRKPSVYRFFDRKIQIKNKRRFIYPIAAIIGICVAVYLVRGIFEKKIEYKDAMKLFLGAQSATYSFQVDTSTGFPAVNCFGMFRHPGKVRLDMGGQMRCWYDLQTGKVTTLIPSAKVASIASLTKEQIKDINKSRVDLLYVQELLHRVCGDPTASVKKLGKNTIDSKKTIGYQFANSEVELNLWVDCETLNPLRIEYKMTYPDGTKCKIIATQIELDSEITDDLMTAVIPDGYTVKEVSNVSMDAEKMAKLNKKVTELTMAIPVLQKAMEEYQSIPGEQVDSKKKSLEKMQDIQNKVGTLTKEVNAMKEAVIE